MKKILTITCHNVYNYGATLQEYALVTYLNQLGFDAKSIRYKPDYLSQHFNIWSVGNPRFDKPILKQLYLLLKLPARLNALKRKKSFDAFEAQHMKFTNNTFHHNNDLKANPPLADAYICGSDQIWNHFFPNGKDKAFYLDFVPENKTKISYAASIATDHIPEKLVSFYQKHVGNIDAVSVREKSAVALLNNIGIKEVQQVLDPVFLLDKGCWETNFVSKETDKYIFVYDFDSNPKIKEAALDLKSKLNCKIFSVNKNIDYADENFWDKDPAKFLSLISQTQYTLTNSFHAVCFSLIFERPLLVFNRNENINTRMQDLLGIMGIENNLISSFDMKKFKLYDINYERVRPLKVNKIKESKDFLKQALSQI